VQSDAIASVLRCSFLVSLSCVGLGKTPGLKTVSGLTRTVPLPPLRIPPRDVAGQTEEGDEKSRLHILQEGAAISNVNGNGVKTRSTCVKS